MQEFHGDKELFKSDHLDWVDVATITRKCRVHSMADYQVPPSSHARTRAPMHARTRTHTHREEGGGRGRCPL